MSFKAIESTESIVYMLWLTYWVVYRFFLITVKTTSFLIKCIPYHYMIKLIRYLDRG